jgi:hypothetical protein
MDTHDTDDTEMLQQSIARTIAVNPAGRNLLLIGGFRYRLLDNSARMSRDVDYDWEGDLADKQAELVRLFERTLLPEVRRNLQYEGSAAPATGPDEDSTVVRTVNLAFWKSDVPGSRIEIPVEITKIAKLDPVVSVVKQGTVYPTASEKDMVESKVIALLNRTFIKHRDFVDVFLFQNQLSADSQHRLSSKFRALEISEERIRKRISDFTTYPAYHAKAIQAVIDDQLDPAAAGNINDAGGGQMILDAVLKLLNQHVLCMEGGQEQ